MAKEAKDAELTVKLHGVTQKVARGKYITAKRNQLREFGYGNLTSDEVSEQIDAILGGKELTVIGMFMEDEIVREIARP